MKKMRARAFIVHGSLHSVGFFG